MPIKKKLWHCLKKPVISADKTGDRWVAGVPRGLQNRCEGSFPRVSSILTVSDIYGGFMSDMQDLLRSLPQVDEVMRSEKIQALADSFPREVIVESVRKSIGKIRDEILNGSISECTDSEGQVIFATLHLLTKEEFTSLVPVVNATGVVLHTNLGRSVLSEHALKEIVGTSGSYSNLEYDLDAGKRGSRHSHVENIIREITGAESAMVVNNNAAATLLVLSALGKGKEIVTSRGELVEIGGSFRIPEIMEQGGAILKEVGTTNRTRKSDYVNAYDSEKTAAFLKVHTSNYQIVGFTENVSIEEITSLAHERNIPAIYDMGSGLFCDLSRYGIDEPVVPQVLKSGVDLVLFSGDKLLGGPQAGIIVGKKQYIDMCKAHPLARALRVDKMTITALCATLYEYKDLKNALTRIPTLNMISRSLTDLNKDALNLAEKIKASSSFDAVVEKCKDQVGGGSAPGKYLDGYLVSVKSDLFSSEELEKKLRGSGTPIICRIIHDNVCFSVRTLQKGDDDLIVEALNNI